ncbi:MAG: phosphoribosylanthranilate isomerase [Halobacteriota archaeon]
MRRVRVKVCGITNVRDLEVAVEAGADALGFVVDVPESPRSISSDRACDLVEATPPFVQNVLVSVFDTVDQLEALCSHVAPDAVQVAGPLPPGATRDQLRGVRVIHVVAVNDDVDIAFPAAKRCDAVLTDSCVPGAHGGTGQPHDWNVSRAIGELIAPTPLILAGGLTPANVRAAIETVRPYAVDVSTGVESRAGIKDPAKIRAFIEAVTEASDGL